jgi:hypothetical protein
MSNTDLDAYKAKHELVDCKKILVNKVLNNIHVKTTPALVEKIKKITLELEECMTAVNTLLYSQDKSVNTSTIALDQFGDHYWRFRPEGTTHIIRHPEENIVYWCRSAKSDAHHIKDIQSIWSLSSWSTHHHLFTKDGLRLDIVKYPSFNKIAIRYDGKVHSLPIPAEYNAIYDGLYQQGLAPTPFDTEHGFIHPQTNEFIDAKEALIYAKYIGIIPEDSEATQLVPAMVALRK